MMKSALVSILVSALSLAPVRAQTEPTPDGPWAPETFHGLALRSIGPAFMSGRIADIAIHPDDDNVWYVAVGSGGVWKTTNAGTTWTPIFDDQASYSIGCITIDPSNPHTIWVGTGENVGGRHVGYGDGIYRSDDGGSHWTHMGLESSEHISKIVVHPTDSDTLWVASQGPLWSKGGQRGVYRTTDGGASWTRTLGDDEWTGATDLAIDPRDPDRIYAATWQRHRTVAAYMGGGPGTGLYRSEDGGVTWTRLERGLPESRMGKIGLAISPQRPDVLYAGIELDRRSGGVFRSTDRGATWEKRSDEVAGGTGPHYYQELYACPHEFDRIYHAGVRMRISDDGGKTFRTMKEQDKHSDNHALAFRSDDPDYLLCGSDGGLYESFDLAETWRFFANLPVTQFYKIALDDTAPFYNVYGGTQDNNTQGGPIRTDTMQGIRNADWRVVLDWDGHQPATEPGNPNILYAERQEGHLARIDATTGEIVDIQPQPAPGEDYERFNWDAPILVSPHQPTRIYFASQRVWRSDHRGDEWTAISGDLTRDQDRIALPIMGGTQSWDNAWDFLAMSNFNTITSLAESPLEAGVLYVGTDDGLIQVTEDGGTTWRRFEVGGMPGVPARAFVNDIKADLFDANTAYVALDNHKEGDFTPYLFKTTDRGRSWQSIRGDLPDRHLVWRVVQDHVRPELMFVGTEFGVFFTVDGGMRWMQLEGGAPTISFRDLAIHRRDDDLVGATFGRGIYVLDDLAPLREVSEAQLAQEATLFATRKAWWYFPRAILSFQPTKGSQGAAHFVAENPPFGAVFTYYLRDGYTPPAEQRAEREKAARESGESIGFPGWDAVEAEARADTPRIWLVVRDTNGDVVRRVAGKTTKGIHRVAWDLRHPTPHAVPLQAPPPPAWGGPPRGLLAAPGRYTVTLVRDVDGVVTPLSEARPFDVVRLREGALDGASPTEVATFWRAYEDAVRVHSAMQLSLGKLLTKIERMRAVIENSMADAGDFDARLHALRSELHAIDTRLNGPKTKRETGEKHQPTLGHRLSAVGRGVDRSTYGPTATNRRDLEVARAEIAELRVAIESSRVRCSALASDLTNAGAPWIEGEPIPRER